MRPGALLPWQRDCRGARSTDRVLIRACSNSGRRMSFAKMVMGGGQGKTGLARIRHAAVVL